jgi:broad specificity phosphatase PhoE
MRALLGVLSLTFVSMGSAAMRGRSAAPASPPLSLVFVVRHAEKSAAPRENPPLNRRGQTRAKALAEALGEAGITAIVTTDQQRTIETAAPLATALHLVPIQLPFRGEHAEDHARAMADAARQAGGVVLLVDHQVAIPTIIAALGGPRVAIVCDIEFSNLYMLVPQETGEARVVYSHYGVSDPPHDRRRCKLTPRSPP